MEVFWKGNDNYLLKIHIMIIHITANINCDNTTLKNIGVFGVP